MFLLLPHHLQKEPSLGHLRRLDKQVCRKPNFSPQLAASLGLIGATVLATATSAAAATYTVTNTNDSGPGSLRDAVAQAEANAGADTIAFDGSLAGQTITLTSKDANIQTLNQACSRFSGNYTPYGALQVTESLTVDGSSAPGITINGNWNGTSKSTQGNRIFYVPSPNNRPSGSSSAAVILNLRDITLENGNAGPLDGGGDPDTPCSNGGNIYFDSNGGELNLTRVTIQGGHANDGGGLNVERGNLNVYNSTLSDNLTRDDGGAIDFSGGGTATAVNSTLADNTAGFGNAGSTSNRGGAVRLDGVMNMTYVTIAHNTASGEGGALEVGSTGTLNVRSSLFVNNDSIAEGNNEHCRILGTLNDLGQNWESVNIVSDTPDCPGFNTDTEANIQLSTVLANNGGTTQTLSLDPSSSVNAVIATSDSLCPEGVGTGDQRYFFRAVGAGCEPGAYELASASVFSVSGTVYQEQGNNSTYDSSTDSPLPDGITLNLYLASDPATIIATTVTGSGNGSYEFGGLPDGDYLVELDTLDADIPSNLVLTTNNPKTVTVSGASQTNVDFSYALPSSTAPLTCPAGYELISFSWATSSTANDGLVWSDPTSNVYNISGNLVTATLNKRSSTSSLKNGDLFTGAFPPPGGGLTWLMNTPDNTNTNNAQFSVSFTYPVPVSRFIIADIDASDRRNPTGWHDQITVDASGPSGAVGIALSPDDPSIITVVGNTAYTSDNQAQVSNGLPDANTTVTLNNLVNTITIEYQDGPRSKSNPDYHGIGIGSFIACYPQVDLGDAPDSAPGAASGDYVTLPTDNGPVHRIVNGLHLGATVDGDDGTLQNGDATADDSDEATNDEDGVQLGGNSLQGQRLLPGTTANLDISTQGNGVLNAWIDWNGDGDFDDTVDGISEQIASNVVPTADAISLSVAVPANATLGDTYARFRYSSDMGLAPTGAASDGEVEDYLTTIGGSGPDVLLVKRITAINGAQTTIEGDNLAQHKDEADNPYDDNTIPSVSDPNSSSYDPSSSAFVANETDQWPTPLSTYLAGGTDGGAVVPDNEIEYTIYFLSMGGVTAENVRFCDYIPDYTSFLVDGFNGNTPAAGGLAGADVGVEIFRNGLSEFHTGAIDNDSVIYFPPGINPASDSRFTGIDCEGDGNSANANPNGAIAVDLGDLINTDATTNVQLESYGYVRFRTRVR
ncbi:MAG: GEVED domain-containing protein [Cyanobacteria bacterium P01_D01_bin.14]